MQHETLPSRPSCSSCQQLSKIYRCQDCFGSHLLCGACCISAHATVPFHRIQMWNGRFFERSDILAHDLTLNLCHYPDDCPSIPLDTDSQTPFDTEISDEDDEFVEYSRSTPHSGSRSNLIIISSTGIFRRSVRWCHCAKKTDQYIQLLLHARLFPASFKNPKTAFTFEVLDHFLIDSLECKTAAMNFMSKIRRMTNEAFPSRVPVRIPMSRTG